MKTKSSMWCNVQEFMLEMKCPGCFSEHIELDECEGDTNDAECKDCGCTFTVDTEIVSSPVSTYGQ